MSEVTDVRGSMALSCLRHPALCRLLSCQQLSAAGCHEYMRVMMSSPACAQVKAQVLLSATEAAEMILRVDDIIKCAPRQRGEQ